MKFHQFWWNSIKISENGWISMKMVVFCYFSWHLLPTLQKACIFYRFWSPPGEQKVRISLIFMEIDEFWWNSIKMGENWWFSWKWVKFALFAPRGGSKPIEYACFFVGLGAGARKSSRKPLFSWKSTNFINFYGIPLKWVDFHEKCGFLSFWWHLLQTIQKRCIFYRFWAPPGSKKWEFHPFSWNSPHFW